MAKREPADSRGKHHEEHHSPINVAAGQQPPRDGEQCGSLTYDAKLRMWLYVASYSDQRDCNVRARSQAEAFRVPFVCVYIGDTSAATGRGYTPRSDVIQRYIPGWYAATYADPRGK